MQTQQQQQRQQRRRPGCTHRVHDCHAAAGAMILILKNAAQVEIGNLRSTASHS
jgi:hypothetical protein